MNAPLQLYAELDEQIGEAATAWNRAALAAWQRLREYDPELVDLALTLFRSEEKAARWFARCHRGATCYGRLASGDRASVQDQLIAALHGFCA